MIRISVFPLSLIALSAFFYAPSQAAETITVRADIWAPYNAQPDSDFPGLAIEMAKEIFGAHGLTLDYQVMPWARAVQACKAGEIDSIMGASGLEEGVVVGKEALMFGTNSVIGLSDQAWEYTDLASLNNIKLAYPRGYNYEAALDTYLQTNAKKNITEVGGDEPLIQAIALLERKRVDGYIEDSLVFFAALPEAKKKQFKVIGALTEPAPIYLAFSAAKPNSKQWVEWLDQGLAEMKKNGRRAAILARYGIVEPVSP